MVSFTGYNHRAAYGGILQPTVKSVLLCQEWVVGYLLVAMSLSYGRQKATAGWICIGCGVLVTVFIHL